MESYIADLINSPKAPKWLKYITVTVICSFIVFLGVMLALKSPMPVGKIFGGILSVLFISAAIYLFVKIAKSKNMKDGTKLKRNT